RCIRTGKSAYIAPDAKRPRGLSVLRGRRYDFKRLLVSPFVSFTPPVATPFRTDEPAVLVIIAPIKPFIVIVIAMTPVQTLIVVIAIATVEPTVVVVTAISADATVAANSAGAQDAEAAIGIPASLLDNNVPVRVIGAT